MSLVIAEILFAAVTQPQAQHLRHLLPLFRGERFVQLHSLLALATTRAILMRIPQHARCTNAATDFFHKCRASQRRGTGRFLCGAQDSFFLWSTIAPVRVATIFPSEPNTTSGSPCNGILTVARPSFIVTGDIANPTDNPVPTRHANNAIGFVRFIRIFLLRYEASRITDAGQG